MISLDCTFILTKMEEDAFEWQKTTGANNILFINKMVCAFNREGFLKKEEIYSSKHNWYYQIVVDKVEDIGYNFISEDWESNWGFKMAFTSPVGGTDFDWYKKLIASDPSYSRLKKLLVLYIL